MKPTLGIKPEKFWLQERVSDLISALERDLDPQPGAWTDLCRCAQLIHEMGRHVERMQQLQACDKEAWEFKMSEEAWPSKMHDKPEQP